MDQEYQDRLSKVWGEWIKQGGDVGKEDRDNDKESFECMRRKLWCDVVTTAMQCKAYDDPVKAADGALKTFDERFGKGEGE